MRKYLGKLPKRHVKCPRCGSYKLYVLATKRRMKCRECGHEWRNSERANHEVPQRVVVDV